MGAARKAAVANGRGNAFECTLPVDSPLRAIGGIERVSYRKLRSATLFTDHKALARALFNQSILVCKGIGRLFQVWKEAL
jgi:hypothetical protein